jgi:GTP pyrophosphokinase
MKSIREYNNPKELRQLMENASRLGNDQTYWQAFSRLCLISGRDDPDPLVRDFHSTLTAFEELLTLKNGRRTLAGLTRQSFGNQDMTDPTVLTDRFDRALLYATHVHGGQVRKGTGVPYIAHLLAVAATVLEYGGSEDMAIAALLHDAVEDQGGEPRLADIRNRFGDRVADIVRSCSDTVVNSSSGQKKEDWRIRKLRYIDHLSSVDHETLLVSLSDKVHNARSILRDLRKPEIGASIWDRFNNSKNDTLWYYREVANAFMRYLPGQLANELTEIVDVLRNS